MVELDLLDANIGETDPGVLDRAFRVLRDTEQPVGDGKQVRPVFGEHRRSTINLVVSHDYAAAASAISGHP